MKIVIDVDEYELGWSVSIETRLKQIFTSKIQSTICQPIGRWNKVIGSISIPEGIKQPTQLSIRWDPIHPLLTLISVN